MAYILAKLSWFCMFVINGYGRKSKRLQSLDFLFYKLQQKSENCKSNQQWCIKWNSKIFIFLKPKIKFDKFTWATRTCENIMLYVLRFTATQCVKLGAKAKQAVYYCSTSESLYFHLKNNIWLSQVRFHCQLCDQVLWTFLLPIWYVIQNFLNFSVKVSCCKLCKLNPTLPMIHCYNRYFFAENFAAYLAPNHFYRL